MTASFGNARRKRRLFRNNSRSGMKRLQNADEEIEEPWFAYVGSLAGCSTAGLSPDQFHTCTVLPADQYVLWTSFRDSLSQVCYSVRSQGLGT